MPRSLAILVTAFCLAIGAVRLSAAPPVGAPTEAARLGEGDLLAGVPGEGPLTVAQVRDWLDRESLPEFVITGRSG